MQKGTWTVILWCTGDNKDRSFSAGALDCTSVRGSARCHLLQMPPMRRERKEQATVMSSTRKLLKKQAHHFVIKQGSHFSFAQYTCFSTPSVCSHVTLCERCHSISFRLSRLELTLAPFLCYKSHFYGDSLFFVLTAGSLELFDRNIGEINVPPADKDKCRCVTEITNSEHCKTTRKE